MATQYCTTCYHTEGSVIKIKSPFTHTLCDARVRKVYLSLDEGGGIQVKYFLSPIDGSSGFISLKNEMISDVSHEYPLDNSKLE